jgi:cell division protease FtsH
LIYPKVLAPGCKPIAFFLKRVHLRSSTYRTVLLWLLILLGVSIVVINADKSLSRKKDEVSWSKFMGMAESGDFKADSIVLGKNQMWTAETKDGEEVKAYGPGTVDAYKDEFKELGITPNHDPDKGGGIWGIILIQYIPFLILFVIIFLFMRQLQAGGGKAMSFGKSRAKLLTEHTGKITFADVAGIDESKDELEEIIQFLKDPKKFTKLGGRIPKGVLLVGPPGTGKTLLARAVAGEAGVPFFSISGSDFVEMFVGVGASRVRDLFEQGKKNAPCIIFIDEIDAVGRHRGAGLGGGHDEREQTLNQLLVEMDGFEATEGVILIAATNRPDVLDPALLRPGRFDRRVVVPRPDVKGREMILKVHTRRTPLSPNVELGKIARGTPGFSGADLESLVNEAALLAARKNKKIVEMDDFEEAKDKVMMGAERRSMVLTEEEKRNTAYHEAGHTLVAKLLPGADPVHKVTIIPRGMALGLTQQLPTEDRYSLDRDHLMTNIKILMGGRAAEEIVMESVTTGAGNDLERATEMARKMVCEWGMSDELGPMTFGHKDEQVFLGKELGRDRDYSESTAVAIDGEVKTIITGCYAAAKGLLLDNLDALHRLANGLLEKEVLDGDEIDSLVEGEVMELKTKEVAPA